MCEFGDFEITPREIIVSTSILAIMIMIGLVISNKVEEYVLDSQEKYYKAVHIDTPELFTHAMNTDIGPAFTYGTIYTIDPVTFPEVNGEYMSTTKITEEWTMFERTKVIERNLPDGRVETYTEVETYWDWYEVKRDYMSCDTVSFMGHEFKYGQLYTPGEMYITSVERGDYRYTYKGSLPSYTGTLFAELRDGVPHKPYFYNARNIDEAVDDATSNYEIIMFWVLWLVLTGVVIYLFFYMENKWLEG